MILILSWTQQRQDLQPTSLMLHIHACFPLVQLSMFLTTWPIGLPAVLFDAAYASAVVHHFNTLPQGFLDG